jgi:6-phosphogluconate dehydrogenase
MSVMGPAPKDISMLIQGKEKADLEIKSLHIQMEQKNIIIENLVKTTGDMKQRMDEMARSFATLTKHRHK